MSQPPPLSPPPPPPRDPDEYTTWLKERQRGTQHFDVRERVMERVRLEPVPLRPWWDRTWVLATAWTAASLLLVVRAVALFAVFWSA